MWPGTDPGKVGSWPLNNSVLNTFDFEPDVLQCLMVLHGLPKVTGVQWNPGGPLGRTGVSGLAAEHLWVLLNPCYLEKAVPYIQNHPVQL